MTAAAPPGPAGPGTVYPAVVTDIVDLGTTVELTVSLDGGPELRSRTNDPVVTVEGETCLVRIDSDAVVVWTT